MDSAAAEILGELGTGAMEPGLDGADRPRDGLSDLVIREILLVEQDEDQAILGTEPLEPPLQLTGQVVGVGQSGPGVDLILDRLRGRERRPAGPPRQRGAAAI